MDIIVLSWNETERKQKAEKISAKLVKLETVNCTHHY